MARTRVSIARKVAGPFDKGAARELTRSHWVAPDSAQHAGIGDLRLGRDDAVGDVVVDSLGKVSVSPPSLFSIR